MSPSGADRPRGGWSLRRRLSLSLAVTVSALWLAAAIVAGDVLRREIDEVFDSALQEVAQRVLPLAYAELLAREDGTTTQHLAPVSSRQEHISYVVRDAEGRELLASSDADLMNIPRDLPPGFAFTRHLRTYTEAAVQGTIVVTTAERMADRKHAVRNAVMALIWPLVALVPIALVAVWLLIRRAVKPVVAFREAIEARDRGNLTPVAGGGLPDEIAPVAAAVNALLERLRGALDAERAFTANSAHELRTPIAAALAQTQRLMAEVPEGPAQDAVRHRARTIAGALRRLSRLSEKLLQLAKAEGGSLLAPHPAPLAPVLRLVIADLDPMGERGVPSSAEDLSLDIAADVVSDLDPDAFAILARNLIENALKHGPAEDTVRVRLAADRLEVTNGGPPVPADRLAQLLRPFERGATSAEGSGLGLAIAAAICRGAGLRLELASPAPGHADGFQATVHFPPPATS
ncbi:MULTISPECIES: sensor histidine kinase [unclassified Xanthobacter]|uniref:sensor histidine kinase n=1 Tax=unclassified Xanthobacter TaxID=2623496 RepID=UPI001EDD0F2B